MWFASDMSWGSFGDIILNVHDNHFIHSSASEFQNIFMSFFSMKLDTCSVVKCPRSNQSVSIFIHTCFDFLSFFCWSHNVCIILLPINNNHRLHLLIRFDCENKLLLGRWIYNKSIVLGMVSINQYFSSLFYFFYYDIIHFGCIIRCELPIWLPSSAVYSTFYA